MSPALGVCTMSVHGLYLARPIGPSSPFSRYRLSNQIPPTTTLSDWQRFNLVTGLNYERYRYSVYRRTVEAPHYRDVALTIMRAFPSFGGRSVGSSASDAECRDSIAVPYLRAHQCVYFDDSVSLFLRNRHAQYRCLAGLCTAV